MVRGSGSVPLRPALPETRPLWIRSAILINGLPVIQAASANSNASHPALRRSSSCAYIVDSWLVSPNGLLGRTCFKEDGGKVFRTEPMRLAHSTILSG